MSENVLAWAKRVKVQTGQSAVMSSITERKEFDKNQNIEEHVQRQPQKKHTEKNTHEADMQVLWKQPSPRQCLAYGMTCMECKKIGQFKAVCRSRRTRSMIEVEQGTVEDNARKNTEMVSMNYIQFYKNCFIKTPAGYSNIIIPFKIDTVNDGNIMPLHVCKMLFPNITNGQLATTKNKNVPLKCITKPQSPS